MFAKNSKFLQKQLPLKRKTAKGAVDPEEQKWLSQRRVDRLKKAEKARSLEIGKRVVNQENPGIMKTLRSLVTRISANGTRFQKIKVGKPRIHAIHHYDVRRLIGLLLRNNDQSACNFNVH